MITKEEYKAFIQEYIKTNDIDFVDEIIATDTANKHTIAEELVDTIAAIYPADNAAVDDEECDKERDNLITAVYEVLEDDHVEEIEKGGCIQIIMIAITEDATEFEKYNNNVWELAEYLTEYATEENLREYERKYNIVNYREEAKKELAIYSAEDFNGNIDDLAEHLIHHLFSISKNDKIYCGYKKHKGTNRAAFERESAKIHATVYDLIYN